MVTAFDSLTSEGKSTNTALFNYRTFMSISGLAPPHAVGMLVHQPDGLTPGHAIGISPKWSYYLESDYGPASGVVAASGVRAQYLMAQATATEQAKLQYAATLADAALAKAATETGSEKNKLLADVADLLSYKNCKDDCTKDLTDFRNKLADKIVAAQQAAQQAAAKLDELVNGKNVVITRWTAGETTAGNVSVVSLGKADGNRQKSLSGIAIFTGLHTRFLFAGEDLFDMAREFVNGKGLAGSALLSELGITTYVVMAEQVEYISDQELEQRATLGVSVPLAAIGKLEQYLKMLPSDQNIGLGLSHQEVSSLGNSGHLENPTHHIKGFSFYPPEIHAAFLAQQAESDKKLITIFAVRGQLKLFETLFAKKLDGTDFGICKESENYCKLGLLQRVMESYQANATTAVANGVNSPYQDWHLPADSHDYYVRKGQAACDKAKPKNGTADYPVWYSLYCTSLVSSPVVMSDHRQEKRESPAPAQSGTAK